MLPSLGTGPTFPSAAADKGEGQLFLVPQVVRGKGQRSGIFPLPIPPHNRWVVGPALPAHPMPWPIRAAALCCPGKLSWVLQSGRGRNSSPALRILGPALAFATEAKSNGGGQLSLAHATIWKMRDRSLFPLLSYSGTAHQQSFLRVSSTVLQSKI